ncbi:hypothetical protein EDD52_103320 [Primorskyibacter sedentarius]|uniref:Uncharacterized protein n=1 Tax=Primorskyibacter sedentarius TaxID=745311 RepID=A0A4R3JLQ3_9RHOB|nr:hypothetical protein EDD52_103320 [Primorskyibacter sedentarius]
MPACLRGRSRLAQLVQGFLGVHQVVRGFQGLESISQTRLPGYGSGSAGTFGASACPLPGSALCSKKRPSRQAAEQCRIAAGSNAVLTASDVGSTVAKHKGRHPAAVMYAAGMPRPSPPQPWLEPSSAASWPSFGFRSGSGLPSRAEPSGFATPERAPVSKRGGGAAGLVVMARKRPQHPRQFAQLAAAQIGRGQPLQQTLPPNVAIRRAKGYPLG